MEHRPRRSALRQSLCFSRSWSTWRPSRCRRAVVLSVELTLDAAAPDVDRSKRQTAGYSERKGLRHLGVGGLDDDAIVAAGVRASQTDVAAAVFQQSAGAIEVPPARLCKLGRVGHRPNGRPDLVMARPGRGGLHRRGTGPGQDLIFADFHSNRHLFITSLERAGLSPKMAQTLARHSDVRLNLGVYTHVGLHDQTVAIASLLHRPAGRIRRPRPPSSGPRGRRAGLASIKWCPLWCPRVPKLVPNWLRQKRCGSHQVAPKPPRNPTKTAIFGSPQSQREIGDAAPIGIKVHYLASLRRADQKKYPRQGSNL